MQLQETKTPRRTKALRFGTVAIVAAAGVLSVASPSWASADTATISPTSGPSGGGNTVTLSVASQTAGNAFIQGSASVVFSAASTCPSPSTAPATGSAVTAANVRVISATKLAVTVPSGVITSYGTAGVTSVCVYNADATGSVLLATAPAAYTVGPAPTITSVTPAAAATQGGGTITIVGTNLGTGTATIGGAPLVSPTATSTSITGTIPAHVAGGPFPVIVSVTGGGGTVTKAAAFTYSSGLVVTPNTAPNTKTRTDIDVIGSGFTSWTFTTTNGTTPNDTNSHVYLVKGAYDPTKSGSAKMNGQTTECMNVLVVSDTELVCSLYLAGGGVPQTATHTVTGTVSAAVFTATTGTFNNGDLGTVVTGSANIPANTTIQSITDSTHAVLSKSATAAITAATALTLNSATRTAGDSTLTIGSTTLTSSAAAFVSTDVGRTVTGTGIPAGTTIVSIGSGSAVLSQAATGATTGSGSFTISYAPTAAPVPNGTYTVTAVSDGGVDVQFGGGSADPSYVRSVINSGSTFTVADF